MVSAKQNRGEGGALILEALIGLTILAIGMGVAFVAFRQTEAGILKREEEYVAMEISRNKIEDFLLNPQKTDDLEGDIPSLNLHWSRTIREISSIMSEKGGTLYLLEATVTIHNRRWPSDRNFIVTTRTVYFGTLTSHS